MFKGHYERLWDMSVFALERSVGQISLGFDSITQAQLYGICDGNI